ncbi:head GIN domain-containing protein [Roseivirga sp.]|uniref:head GIN domain-containing protein n=1 Tax=Roseivirga sp. TaxID=1964215 RepID=UPI003B51F3CA
MKKQLKIYVALALLVMSVTGCYEDVISGRGPVVEEEYAVNDFTSLYLQLPARLYVYEGSEPSVRIRTNQNLHSRIEAEVISGELKIKTIPNVSLRSIDVMDVYVSSSAVNEFRINGSGVIRIEDCLNANALSFHINGSGVIYACGNTGTLEVEVNGSGKFYGSDLQSEHAELTIYGSGDIETRVSESLDVHIAGSGNIAYYGNPQVTSQISGSGKIRKK